MNDTQRLDFILKNSAEVYETITGKWICMIDELTIGTGSTGREAIDGAIANPDMKWIGK